MRFWISLLALALCLSCATSGQERKGAESAREVHETLLFGEPTLHPEELEGCAQGQEGNGLLVLVNKEPGQELACNWRPPDLRRLERDLLVPGKWRRHQKLELRAAAAEAFRAMALAARRDKVRIYVRSAYRSYGEQKRLFRHKVKEHGRAHARRYSAEPGRSQHQLGTAIDVTNASQRWRIEETFARSRASAWLEENAHRFGFALSYPEDEEHETGYGYEPWHFRYIGEAAAQELASQGLSLERYLRGCQQGVAGLRCPDYGRSMRVSSAKE